MLSGMGVVRGFRHSQQQRTPQTLRLNRRNKVAAGLSTIVVREPGNDRLVFSVCGLSDRSTSPAAKAFVEAVKFATERAQAVANSGSGH
jgi:hypothetical protein